MRFWEPRFYRASERTGVTEWRVVSRVVTPRKSSSRSPTTAT